jgi:hypothetical protein
MYLVAYDSSSGLGIYLGRTSLETDIPMIVRVTGQGRVMLPFPSIIVQRPASGLAVTLVITSRHSLLDGRTLE